jgi:Holliday junction resolvase
MCGQSVHERLAKIGAINKMHVLSKDDYRRLQREYLQYAEAGNLAALAASMNRTKNFICRAARELGLTDANRPKRWMAVWKYMTEQNARLIFDKFKASSLGIGKYCNTHGYDDLGFMRTLRGFFPDEWEAVIESKTPAQTKYRIGRQFEYRVRDAMRAAGYFVTRSPASRSPIDLMAVRPGSVVFVQCKRSGAFPVNEWNEFFDLCVSTGATPVLAAMPLARGMTFYRLLGRKDGSRSPQPFEAWSLMPKEEALAKTSTLELFKGALR